MYRRKCYNYWVIHVFAIFREKKEKEYSNYSTSFLWHHLIGKMGEKKKKWWRFDMNIKVSHPSNCYSIMTWTPHIYHVQAGLWIFSFFSFISFNHFIAMIPKDNGKGNSFQIIKLMCIFNFQDLFDIRINHSNNASEMLHN